MTRTWLKTDNLLNADTDVRGKTVFIYNRDPDDRGQLHGIGDALQHCRIAIKLKNEGAKRVIVQAQEPVLNLLRTIMGVDEAISFDAPIPSFDFHSPFFAYAPRSAEQPYVQRIDSFFFAADNYVSADPHKILEWESRLGPKARPRIGVNWAASVSGKVTRSISFQEFKIILSDEFEFISLRPDCAEPTPGIRTFPGQTVSLDDVAAICMLCDLVISVDTGLLHLAAALGRPAWGIIPVYPDWRWGQLEDKTVWYSRMKLYRQQQYLNWIAPLIAINHDLKELLDETPF